MFCNSFVGDNLYSNGRLNFWAKIAPILGGLTREFFTLAFKEFSFKYLEEEVSNIMQWLIRLLLWTMY